MSRTERAAANPFFSGSYLLDPVFPAPAILLMTWAQYRVHSTCDRAKRVGARLSGVAAARSILDSAGLRDVEVEKTGGMLSDHSDSRHRVPRLSRDVDHGRRAAAVGIAAHEAGHALQQQHDPVQPH